MFYQARENGHPKGFYDYDDAFQENSVQSEVPIAK